ncbi:unnamed protein product [marine sediment metagenome]|uniref:Uncharacterized protein n=1 Tax=marine sediment metagenome TaxID=412755 RepID=X1I377_9ZZZZ
MSDPLTLVMIAIMYFILMLSILGHILLKGYNRIKALEEKYDKSRRKKEND